MTGEWQGYFKAVSIERALLMDIPNKTPEERGIDRIRKLKLQGLVDNLKGQ
jgi:hypothetical protein